MGGLEAKLGLWGAVRAWLELRTGWDRGAVT